MNAHAPMQVAPENRRRPAYPTCPQCNDVLFAAAASEHVSERHVRHVWSCESCGHVFATLVRLSFPRLDAMRAASPVATARERVSS
jgi:transcription elongation factor Elf1